MLDKIPSKLNGLFGAPQVWPAYIADGYRRLIENSIIYWNYLYLSKLISDAESDDQKTNLINTIKNGSVITWQHINLQGEYDFSEERLENSMEFSLPELLELQVA